LAKQWWSGEVNHATIGDTHDNAEKAAEETKKLIKTKLRKPSPPF
jgi:hypothetical protein